MKDILGNRARLIALIFIAAFLVRLLAVFALRNIHAGPTMAFGADGFEFNTLARQVSLGNGYGLQPGHPTAFRAPGFPLFLAAIDFLAGQHYPLDYLVFCGLGAIACVLTFLMTSELAGQAIGALAGVFAVFYIGSVYDVTVFASENLFVVCLGLTMWLFLRAIKRGSTQDLVFAGLALGWGILTRPFALLLVPMFVCVLLWEMWKGTKIRFLQVVLFAVIPMAVLAPWVMRNDRVFHHPVLGTTNGGSTFYGGNNDRVLHEPYYYGSWISTEELPYRNLIDATPDEVAHDKEEWHLGIEWVKEHERSMPLLWFYKLVRMWLPDVGSLNRKYVMLQVIGATPFLILTLIGLFQCLRDRRYWTDGWLLAHGIIAATVVTCLVFWGSPRFRDANLPVLMAYAAVGMQAMLPRSKRLVEA